LWLFWFSAFGSVLLQRLLCFAHSFSIMLKVPFANKMFSHVTVKFYFLIPFLNPFWKAIQPQYKRFHSIDLWHIVLVYCIQTLLCNYVKDDQQSMNRCFGSGSGWSVFKAFYNSTLQYRREISIHWKGLQNTHVAISRHSSSAIWHVDYVFVDLIKIFMCTCCFFFSL